MTEHIEHGDTGNSSGPHIRLEHPSTDSERDRLIRAKFAAQSEEAAEAEVVMSKGPRNRGPFDIDPLDREKATND